MRTLVVLAIGLVAFGSGVMLGFKLDSEADGAATTESSSGLPAAVEATRAALLAAAESGDYETVRRFLPAEGEFRYTFGGAVPGGPIAYWRRLEQERPERPLETLAAILKLPYTLSRGYYVWPFAYDVAGLADLSPHERELLAPLGSLDRLFFADTGYLGWRAGIAPDGTWAFYVSGD